MEGTIVLYPSPGRGHLVSMVELGKLILTHYTSFSITIIISTPPFNTDTTSSYIAAVSAATPSITFQHLPPVPLSSATSSGMPTLTFELAHLNNPNLLQTLSSISKSSNLKAFIIDFFCNPSFEVSSALNIPTYYFFTSSANGLAAFVHLPTLHETTTQSLKDLDVIIDVPGLPPIPAYNLPQLMLDRSSKVYQYFMEAAIQMPKSAGLIVNTFDSLEQRALGALSNGLCVPGQKFPPIYCLGPLLSSEEQRDQHECLSWLHSQPRQSVVYVSFGSIASFAAKQLREIAIGLENSGVRFLWVVRPTRPEVSDPSRRGLVSDEVSLEALLPKGFLDRTRERAYVVKSWAPQVAVLSHNSVGGFVTHCGWNSILEAICAGVPMVAWPLFAEQKVNRAFLAEEIKVAVPMAESRDGFVSASELEQRVTELMNSENGTLLRQRVTELREAALVALSQSGSSRDALSKLAESLH